MAITHDDMRTQHWRHDVGSRLALFLIFLSVLCGLISFVLYLAAEASRSEWPDAARLRRVRLPPAHVHHVRGACLHAGGGHVSKAPGAIRLLVDDAGVDVDAPRRSAHTLLDDPCTHSSTARSLTWQARCLFQSVSSNSGTWPRKFCSTGSSLCSLLTAKKPFAPGRGSATLVVPACLRGCRRRRVERAGLGYR
ncbi:hypothetical protein Cni_G10475 [Canna indica]|uniref:Uncharacterized protein n=1 Tax=Canna indica TaxID=4628 RepID=A0AAQ3K4B1_9LILI|nr:hypothetical protein Cni_G10475 [Canna indica]